MIVVAIVTPWTGRHLAHFHKLPIRHIGWCQTEIITDRRRNVQARPMVEIWLRPLILENVLKMISAKRTTIFPLRVASAIAFSDGDPAILAH